MKDKKQLVIGITGASGAVYAIRLLELLKAHPLAKQTISAETNYSLSQVRELADHDYDVRDIGAAVSSGSFRISGMVVLPCSIKTLSGIANCYADDLITRAADVCLKEYNPLILCVRETPLHLGHLRLMTQAAEIGARIVPLMPAFYHRPQTVDDIINQGVNRLLDQLDISLEQDLFERWQGNK